MAKAFLLFSVILFTQFASGTAQPIIGTWNSYSSYNSVKHIVVDKDGIIWSATNGGLFSATTSALLKTYSTVSGLYGTEPSALIYDTVNNGLWLGYNDGMIEFFDIELEKSTRFSDLFRNERYTSKKINDFYFSENLLYISTDFGVVVWDPSNFYVKTSYVNFGTLGMALKTNQIAILGDTLVALTIDGLAYGNNAKDDLVLPNNWKSISIGQSNLSSEPLVGIADENQVLISTASTNLIFKNGVLSSNSSFDAPVKSYSKKGSALAVLTNTSIFEKVNASFQVLYQNPTTKTSFNKALILDSKLILATNSSGLFSISAASSVDTLLPDGPFLNFFSDMNVHNGILVSASSSSPGKVASSYNESGFYVYDKKSWNSYNVATNAAMKTEFGVSFYRAAVSDSYYAFGSWGNGLALYKTSDKSVQVFKNTNSPIPGINGVPWFVVVTGVDFDSNNKIWLTTFNELVSYEPESQTWTVSPKTPLIGSSDLYFDLFIDSFNQFWIPLSSGNSGRGVLVLNTKGTTTTSDDTGFRLNSSIEQGFLPSDEVTAITQDKRGEIWVGSTRGLVRFLFPERIIEGTSNDRRAEYLRNTAGDSTYFRDIDVTTIAVDAANQKWVGTANNGVWHLTENGDKIIKQFTTSNSPLPSNSIRSIAVDDKKGIVYIATDIGLVSFVDVTTASTPDLKTLKVYPNPLVYANLEQNRIIIEGLAEETTVRILSTSGMLIDEFPAKGGRVQWIPRTKSGQKLASGIYFVISVETDGTKTATGKFAVIR